MAARSVVNHGENLARAQAVRASWFNYNLPPERIALHPVQDRSSSRLLVARKSLGSRPEGMSLVHHKFHQLPSFLPENSLLVMNNSQVIPARIPMRKTTGAKAEILLLSPRGESDPTAALDMPLEEGRSWKCIVGGRRIHPGDVLVSDSGPFLLKAEILSRDGTAAMVQFHTDTEGLSLATAIQSIGKTPLPPYIKRAVDADDARAYQTVYAERAGSVAAPTAGLHMTDEVLKNIRARGVHISTVTLHVGAGTFAQLGGPTAGDHRMHAERFTVSAETMCDAAECARDQRQLTALGTTSVRTLESMYWHGVRILHGKKWAQEPYHSNYVEINQWDPYKMLDSLGSEGLPSVHEAFTAVRENAHDGSVSGITRLLIVPGYRFRVVDNLLTNFHQPASTLLMLVAAFCGSRESLFDVYAEALRENYRFLSYGDSSLLLGGS